MRYTVVIEKEKNSCYGAYVPDFPGAVGIGDSRQEAIESVRQSILLLLEYDRERNEPLPSPRLRTQTFMGYLIVIDENAEDWGDWEGACLAFAPDLPGCARDGDTSEEAATRVRESIRRYVDEARHNGLPVPEPGEWTATIEVAAPSTPGSKSLSA